MGKTLQWSLLSHWFVAGVFVVIILAPDVKAEQTTFLLDDSAGSAASVDGKVIRATSAMMVIRLLDGGLLTVPTSAVSGIRTLVEGAVVEGKLVEWIDGTYVVLVDERLLYISDGKVVPQLVSKENEAAIRPADNRTSSPPKPSGSKRFPSRPAIPTM